MTASEEQKRSDPRKLAYLYPSMPLVTFAKQVSSWHEQEQLELIKRLTMIADRVLVHRSYLSDRQRRENEAKQIKIGRSIYYSLHWTELPVRARIAWDAKSLIIKQGDTTA